MRVRFGAYVRQKHVFDYELEALMASAPPHGKNQGFLARACTTKSWEEREVSVRKRKKVQALLWQGLVDRT